MRAGQGLTSKGRAADQLVEIFAGLIESGALKEGEALPPEREIVETYGVSRTVAREAVQTLAARGLVEARPRYRPVVRRPSFETAMETVSSVVGRMLRVPDGVKDLFDARVLIEAGLVRQAAETATPAKIIQMEHFLEANRDAIPDSRKFYETDLAFHRQFYEISGNPVVASIHSATAEWLSPHWKRMPPSDERNARNYQAHAAIFQAIKSGDADQAEAALRSHLADAWEQVRATFE